MTTVRKIDTSHWIGLFGPQPGGTPVTIRDTCTTTAPYRYMQEMISVAPLRTMDVMGGLPLPWRMTEDEEARFRTEGSWCVVLHLPAVPVPDRMIVDVRVNVWGEPFPSEPAPRAEMPFVDQGVGRALSQLEGGLNARADSPRGLAHPRIPWGDREDLDEIGF